MLHLTRALALGVLCYFTLAVSACAGVKPLQPFFHARVGTGMSTGRARTVHWEGPLGPAEAWPSLRFHPMLESS